MPQIAVYNSASQNFLMEVSMTDYFSEKATQVDPSTLIAFGIEVDSRYGRASELIELINFAEACAQKNVAHYVKRAFYDSKACMCSFEIGSDVAEGDLVATAIFEAARQYIGQFMWFDDVVHHGGAVAAMY